MLRVGLQTIDISLKVLSGSYTNLFHTYMYFMPTCHTEVTWTVLQRHC